MNSAPLLLGLSIMSLAFVALFAGLSYRLNLRKASIGQLTKYGTAVIVAGSITAGAQYALYQVQPSLVSGDSWLVLGDIFIGFLAMFAFWRIVD